MPEVSVFHLGIIEAIGVTAEIRGLGAMKHFSVRWCWFWRYKSKDVRVRVDWPG